MDDDDFDESVYAKLDAMVENYRAAPNIAAEVCGTVRAVRPQSNCRSTKPACMQWWHAARTLQPHIPALAAAYLMHALRA